MMLGKEAEFHEGIMRVVFMLFGMYKTLVFYDEMVDVDDMLVGEKEAYSLSLIGISDDVVGG